MLAVEQKARGVFNIVDDEPAPASQWLPYLAACAGAKPPVRVPKWVARLLAGDVAVIMMTEGRGFCNAKAKRELGWELRYPSWRQGFREGLAADASMVGDGGGKAPALARSIIGADNVARVLASIFPWLVRIEVTLEPREVNGQPGAIFRDRDGKVLNTLALDILQGRIQTIRSVINPDKLGHVGPVADARAVAREVNQARRPKD